MAGIWFVKPITTLVKNLRRSNPEKSIMLDKTNIMEIDDLATAIEILSTKVADSSSKISEIIGMVKRPVGAFEYNLDEDNAFCTEAFFNILGIERANNESRYISAEYFNQILNSIRENPEPDMDNIYFYNKKDGKLAWIHLQMQEDEEKKLGIIEDVSEEIKNKLRIEYERDHDLLTNLLNRGAFQVYVCNKLQGEDVKIAAVVMWDLDNLKYINDTYGHDFGDQYIKTAAGVLSELRVYNAIVARMSGDEFYVFIYGYQEKEEIREIVKMMHDKLLNTIKLMVDGRVIRIRASAGIAWYPDDSKNYEELIRYSDFAMYKVKNSNKGKICEFDKESYNKDSFLLHGREELNRFIDEELVCFAFQPIVDARNGNIYAYEALMRPQVDTLRSPLDLIRLANSQSKLYAIERITWFKAMEAFEEQNLSLGKVKIFINSVPNHVLSDEDLKLFEDKYKSYLSRIVIEVIENEQANEHIIKKKQALTTRWGSQLALDDFGAGYNSELALLILSPSFVKIDMGIIRGIDQDFNRQKLLINLLSYAKGRKIKVIAEGVETKGEMDKLIELGVDFMQGYYFGKPNTTPQQIPPKIVEEIVEKNN